jgi:hypothetical protein
MAAISSDMACAPPGGNNMCPTTSGNCKSIGKPCTHLGGQCPSGTYCERDLDSTGDLICVSLGCTPLMGQCGRGASCCNTATTQNHAICLPNGCIPDDCKPMMEP